MNDLQFVDFIKNCKKSEADMTKALGISKSTIQRWKSGHSSPHPAIRASIVETINMLT